MNNQSSTIDVPADSSPAVKGRAPLFGHVVQDHASTVSGGGYKRGLCIVDFILRLGGIISAIYASVTMYTSDEALPFFTQFSQFEAGYDDLPSLGFFMAAMAVVASCLLLSLPFSGVAIVRPHSAAPRLILLIFDTGVLGLNMAASASATAIVSLAHDGNPSTNWLEICSQYGTFCEETSRAVVVSYVSVLFFSILVVLSGFALKH